MQSLTVYAGDEIWSFTTGLAKDLAVCSSRDAMKLDLHLL